MYSNNPKLNQTVFVCGFPQKAFPGKYSDDPKAHVYHLSECSLQTFLCVTGCFHTISWSYECPERRNDFTTCIWFLQVVHCCHSSLKSLKQLFKTGCMWLCVYVQYAQRFMSCNRMLWFTWWLLKELCILFMSDIKYTQYSCTLNNVHTVQHSVSCTLTFNELSLEMNHNILNGKHGGGRHKKEMKRVWWSLGRTENHFKIAGFQFCIDIRRDRAWYPSKRSLLSEIGVKPRWHYHVENCWLIGETT